jgi:hypothetical protein
MDSKADFRATLVDTPSHILPLIIGEAHQCRRTSELLMTEHGIYLQPANYPTVRGQKRLRITPTPFHTDHEMQQSVDALAAVRTQLGWPLAEALHEQTVASVGAAPLVFDAARTPDATGGTEREEPCSA